MEFLSASQLQKYEEIIDEIKTEFEKYEQRKSKLEEENDKIIVSRLVDNKLSEKVSHVNVKIFNDVTELLNLYSGELGADLSLSKLAKYDNCKFYLIEIYISKTLMQKIKDFKWLLHLTLKSEKECINKTLSLTQKSPFLEVIALDENVMDCEIQTSLVLPSNNKWMIIKLDTILVDISFHFHMYKERRKDDFRKRILQIMNCYNQSLNPHELVKPVMLEYKLVCDVEKSNFIQSILRNSYHKLDIELFSQLGDENEFVLQFSSGLERHKLVYNKQHKLLIIKSNIKDLCLLKKYFYKEFCGQNLTNQTATSLKIKENISKDSQEACSFYKELRKTWSALPL